MNFKGAAKKLDDIDLPTLGKKLSVGEDELHAFIDVETRGSGFDDKGRPRILFERHKFWKYCTPAQRQKAPDDICNKVPGGYGKASEQYDRLARAMKINAKAALYACSWGLGQMMGFNHELAGYATVEAMIEAFKADEENHLAASVNFILRTGLDDELRKHDWAGFARGYNGPDYKRNSYDRKLRDAYAKWSRIKDTPLPDAIVEKLPAEPAKNVEVIAAPGPTPGETTVVIAPAPQAPPATPKVPTKPKGLAVLGALLAAVATAVWNYLQGGGQ